METRIAVNNDKDTVKELWKNSFQYTKGFLDWYFEKVFAAENTFITTEEFEPISSLSIIPQRIKISGFETDAAYISGLAVLPEYRNDETMKKQLTDAIVSVAKKGYLLSVVIPSDYRFYERYGWRTAYSYKQYDIKPADLPAYQIKNKVVRAKISDETISALTDVYNSFMSDKNAYTVRSKDDWQLILEDLLFNFGGQCIIFKNEENIPTGYILDIVREHKMGVYEFAYKDRSAYESIIGFIRSYELNVDSVAIKAAADDLSYLDFCDNREAVHYCPFAMARLSDVKKALKIASVNITDGFKIQVIDRLVEANNKTFFVSTNSAEEADDEGDVVTDIGTLTQLFMGYISVDEAKRMNLIGKDASLLKKIFDKKNNYINMLLA